MKKAVSLLLAFALCLTLCACGGEQNNPTQGTQGTNEATPESALVGQWKDVGGSPITFHADGTGIAPYGDDFDWRYDKESSWYYVSYQGVSFSFTIKTKDNARYITLEGTEFYHADDYAPVRAAYVKEKLAKLTNGRIEMLPGNTYTTESGEVFTLDRVELREGKSPWGDEIIGSFTLYITSESEIDIGDTDYNTPGRYSGFGLASQSYSSEGNTYCFSGGFEEMADLKADQDEEFGILTFNVNGSAYYIQIQTFFG